MIIRFYVTHSNSVDQQTFLAVPLLDAVVDFLVVLVGSFPAADLVVVLAFFSGIFFAAVVVVVEVFPAAGFVAALVLGVVLGGLPTGLLIGVFGALTFVAAAL